jgi:hypothetical protein
MDQLQRGKSLMLKRNIFVLLTTLFLAFSSSVFAQAQTKALAPNGGLQNLYAARASGSSPYFQTKSRALVGKYFTKDLADLIWQDVSRGRKMS